MGNDKRGALQLGLRSSANARALAIATCVCVGMASAAHAQVTENVLYSFPNTGTPSEAGGAPLIVDTGGEAGAARALYGVNTLAGAGNCTMFGCGTAFKLTSPKMGHTAWDYTLLWQFTGGADGGTPESALHTTSKRISRDTPLYGTTLEGNGGNGSVYRLVGNTLTTIYGFSGGADGGTPYSSNVVSDETGALYVALFVGGFYDCGTVDKLTPPAPGQTTWSETTIWTFSKVDYDDGCSPTGLVMDKSGALFGATAYGNFPGGYNGTIFKLTPPANGSSAWQEETLYKFTPIQNEGNSYSNLTIGKDGVLYGTENGEGDGQGLVFAVTPPKGKAGWTGQVIWNFTGGDDGYGPNNSILVDRNGVVYGTAEGSGSGGGGTVYKLTPPANGQGAWTETTLWSFSIDEGTMGIFPDEGLVADKAGTLYGLTAYGGATFGGGCNSDYGCGAVYSLTGTGFAP